MRWAQTAVAASILLATTTTSDSAAGKRKGYVAPKRTVTQVAYAIGTSHPSMKAAEKKRLATLLVRVAKKHNFDPLSGWAIIDHESDWRKDAVSADGQDIGLAQIRYTQTKECRKDRESDACQARKEALFDPKTNIRAMANAITAWRKLCKKKTGRPANMKNWLAGYGGYSRPKKNIFCGRKRVKTKRGYTWKELPVPKAVNEILVARKAMIRRLRKERVK